jgi:predicted permease
MPDWTRLVRERLPPLYAPEEREREIVEELAAHLDSSYEEARESGATEDAAMERALSLFSDWPVLANEIEKIVGPAAPRRTWRRATMGSGLLQDVRYGIRTLTRAPTFTTITVCALALAIGGTAVAFSFVHGVLFRHLPVPDPERLVRIYSSGGFEFGAISYPDYVDIRGLEDVFEGVLVDKIVPVNLGTERSNERIWGYMVSGNYFSALGVEPALGRFFLPEEGEAPHKHPVVVLHHGFWTERFASDPSVLGSTIRLNGHPYTVVGVAPPGFDGINVGLRPKLFSPAMMQSQLMPGVDRMRRENRSYLSLARLADGVSIDEARTALDVLAERLQQEYPENEGLSFRVLPALEGGVHPIMRGGFIGFSGVVVVAVALTLLLACANVAGLLLAKAAHRRKEVSLRLAIGASRLRLVRQLLTESFVLSIAAGGLGLLLAVWGMHLLGAMHVPTDVPLFLPLVADARVVAFTLAISVLTALLFGLTPALRASRPDLVPGLKDVPGSSASRHSTLRSMLVSGQVALSTVLLIGTGLFLRSLGNAHAIDVGFEGDGVVMASFDLDLQGYDEQHGVVFLEQLLARLRTRPEVSNVAFVDMVPFGLDINTHAVAPEGYEKPADTALPAIHRNIVSEGYFETMRTELLSGRDFTERDDSDSPPVVIINQALAERFWPSDGAVGKRLGRPGGTMYQVVGVVETGKYLTLGEDPKPFLFYPFRQRSDFSTTVVARVGGDPSTFLPSLREEVLALDSTLPVYNLKSVSEHVEIATAPAAVGAALLGSFGTLAVVLASIGLYGVMAFTVAQRTSEIGIRRALGATNAHILGTTAGRGALIAGSGLLAGLVMSFLTSRVAVSVLYGISPSDPIVYLGAALVLSLSAIVACYFPARRGLDVDPIVALRYE